MEISASLVLSGIVALFVVITILGGFFTVDQNELAVVERFGKFVRTASPGLNFKIPFIEHVKTRDSRIIQLDVDVETKTKDNVFVKVKVGTQYQIADIQKAVYKLQDVKTQLASFVFDVVRAQVPKLGLDEVFEKKDDIAQAVKMELTESMDDFGFLIVKTLVTDIDPDAKVKESMNEINAAQRIRMAAQEKGEADKILMIKAAEAEAESKRLQGEGIAHQRAAIIKGLKDSIEEMQKVTGQDSGEVMNLILLTQYFDTIKAIGEKSHTNTIMLPHQPGAIGDIQQQIMSSILVGQNQGHGVKKTPRSGN